MKGDSYKIHTPSKKAKPAIFAYTENYDSTYDDDIWAIDIKKIPEVKWYRDLAVRENKSSVIKAYLTYDNIPRDAIMLVYKGTGDSLI